MPLARDEIDSAVRLLADGFRNPGQFSSKEQQDAQQEALTVLTVDVLCNLGRIADAVERLASPGGPSVAITPGPDA